MTATSALAKTIRAAAALPRLERSRRHSTLAELGSGPGAAAALAGIGGVRVALGVAAVTLPRLVGRPWIGHEAEHPGAALLLRSVGGRDLGLGLGTVAAFFSGRALRPWALAGAISDTSDALATLLAFRHLPPRMRFVLFGASGAIAFAGFGLTSRLGRP